MADGRSCLVKEPFRVFDQLPDGFWAQCVSYPFALCKKAFSTRVASLVFESKASLDTRQGILLENVGALLSCQTSTRNLFAFIVKDLAPNWINLS